MTTPTAVTALHSSRRAFWLKHLHRWHWVSSAVCLVGMLAFAATGLTLNHAAAIESKPDTITAHATLPPALLATLSVMPADSKSAIPTPISRVVADTLGVRLDGRAAEWSADEIYVSLPRPGGDAWLTIDRETGAIAYERTNRGWIAYLNDLHKGRNTGLAWTWFLDVFTIGCVIFCITGLFLLQMHARQRPTTWPLVALGLVIPLLLGLLFVH